MEFDDIFQYIGEFRLYQIFLYLLLGILAFYDGYQSIAMTFLGGSQEHWCKIERLETFPYDHQKYVGIPYDQENDEYSSCEYYDLDYDDLTDDEIWNWNWTLTNTTAGTLECKEWVYDKSEFVDTVISEYDLVCDNAFKVDLVSSIFLSGILIGSPLSGALSDRFGRKIVLLIGCAFHLIFGIAAAFSPTYAWFVSLRFCLSVANSFAYLTGFVIIVEIIGPKFRTVAGVCYQMWFAVGFMVLPGMAYFVRDFRNLQIVMAVPVAITAVYIFLVPESPRWLVSQDRVKEAEVVLQKIADVNNCQLPDKLEFTPQTGKDNNVEKGKFSDLFTHPILCREILIIYLCWLTNSLVYYGLSLNTGALVGDVFLNTFISGLVEIPANIVCILAMQYVGRNPTLTWSYMVAGLTAFLCIPFLDNPDLSWLVTTLTMIGKAAITVSFSSIYVYTAELFPTPVRHLAMGSSSMMSRIGGLVAPFMGEPLMNIWLPMPSVIFGVMGVITGIFTCFLPETLNKKLPDTIAEAEEIGRVGSKKSNSKYDFVADAMTGTDNMAYQQELETPKYNKITEL